MIKFVKALCLTAVFAATSVMAAADAPVYQKGSINIKDYPKGDILITAEDAVKLIGKKGVVFVSGDSPDSYKNQHIAGSVVMGAHHLHHADIMGAMHCAPLYQCIKEAEHHIGEKGIDNDTLVIAYDDYRGPNATGVYSFFSSYGHKKVKILMGGFKAIQALDPSKKKVDAILANIKKSSVTLKLAKKIARFEKNVKKAKAAGDDAKAEKNAKKLKKELAKAAKIKNFKAVVAKAKKDVKSLKKALKKAQAKLLVNKKKVKIVAKHYHIDPKKVDYSGIASKQDVKHAMHDIAKHGKKSKFVIIDARGMTEIIGERKMDNVARGGHIPGATFMEWKNISDNDRVVAFKSAKKLAATFKKYGLTKDKTIYAYCHVGAGRGSEVVSALKIMGYKHAKVYTGSWDEWGNDMMLPIKR